MVSYSPGWPLTHCVVEAGCELPLFLPAPSQMLGLRIDFMKCWQLNPGLVRTRQALCRLSRFPSFSFWISKRGQVNTSLQRWLLPPEVMSSISSRNMVAHNHLE